MAGCEYLPNIERVGLKVALKHFAKHGSFEAVMKFLRTNKATKDKIPVGYEVRARQVVELFSYQTVFDTETESLTQLSSIYDTAELDMDYLGPHEALLENLPEFTKGEIYRSSGAQRKSYMGQSVIDMSLVRMHFARGEITDRSFVCTDLTFFQEDESRNKASEYNPHATGSAGATGPEEEKKDNSAAGGGASAAVDYARMGQAMAGKLGAALTRPCQEARENLDRLIANNLPGRARVTDTMFGFVDEEDDGEDDAEAGENEAAEAIGGDLKREGDDQAESALKQEEIANPASNLDEEDADPYLLQIQKAEEEQLAAENSQRSQKHLPLETIKEEGQPGQNLSAKKLRAER